MTTTWVEGDKGRAVAISAQPGYATARVYVGGAERIATLRSWEGKTEAGARKWAAKQLAR